MNNDRIKAIKERYEKAAVCCWSDEVNASFYDIPYLLTEIDRLNSELADLRADYNGVMRIQAELLHDKKYLNSRLEASQRREQAVSETIKEAMHIVDKKSCVDYYDNSICMLCKHDNPFMPVDGACEACKRADHFEFIGQQEGGE